MEDHLTFEEQLKQHQAAAKTATQAEQTVAEIPSIELGSTQVDQWSALKPPLESPSRRNSPPSTSAMPGEQLTLF